MPFEAEQHAVRSGRSCWFSGICTDGRTKYPAGLINTSAEWYSHPLQLPARWFSHSVQLVFQIVKYILYITLFSDRHIHWWQLVWAVWRQLMRSVTGTWNLPFTIIWVPVYQQFIETCAARRTTEKIQSWHSGFLMPYWTYICFSCHHNELPSFFICSFISLL